MLILKIDVNIPYLKHLPKAPNEAIVIGLLVLYFEFKLIAD